jgi:dephospho-CoA kinase
VLKIGITGGIGSGKTTVAGIIEQLGHPVYASDAAAARLVNADPGVREALVAAFGPGVYAANGELDKARFASLIFHDEKALARANAIIHPAVTRDFREWCAARHEEPLLFLESAILRETGLAGAFDAVITVVADLQTRVERVTRRDGVPRERVLERVACQAADDAALPGFVVRNNPGDMLVEQVLTIIKELAAWQG